MLPIIDLNLCLQLLVLELALKLLHLRNLPNSLVEVVLVDRVAVVLDGEQSSVFAVSNPSGFLGLKVHVRFRNHVSQVGTVQLITHLDHTLVVDFSLLLHTFRVNLENFHPAHLVG